MNTVYERAQVNQFAEGVRARILQLNFAGYDDARDADVHRSGTRASTEPHVSERAFARLSPREGEVFSLLADGRSNQEIAEALYISVRTVSTHVTSILTKLNVSSRSAAAAYAYREGLL